MSDTPPTIVHSYPYTPEHQAIWEASYRAHLEEYGGNVVRAVEAANQTVKGVRESEGLFDVDVPGVPHATVIRRPK